MGPRSVTAESRGHAENQCREAASLQWGRGHVTAETWSPFGITDQAAILASMGPRSVDRGEEPLWLGGTSGSSCFNGAAVIRPRRLSERSSAIVRPGLASMGPRSVDRGDHCSHVAVVIGIAARLQWGRGRETAERSTALESRCCDHGFNGAAVFRPRRAGIVEPEHDHGRLQWGRGLSTAETSRSQAAPRLRGLLQWGRGLSTAESESRGTRACRMASLQWGRGLSTAESASAAANVPDRVGFNGAAIT